jgi:hypothetical protein
VHPLRCSPWGGGSVPKFTTCTTSKYNGFLMGYLGRNTDRRSFQEGPEADIFVCGLDSHSAQGYARGDELEKVSTNGIANL